jgi:hypothetical protein
MYVIKKWSFAVLFAVVAVCFYTLQQPLHPPPQLTTAAATRVVRTLPSEPVLGVSSSSSNIFSTSEKVSTTAAGQIFAPPAEAPVMQRIGFMFSCHRYEEVQPPVSYQIILAQWQVDRPSSTEIWTSNVLTLPSIADDCGAIWQDIEVPSITLDANKQYIAWITLSDLGNPPGASVGIPDMGPTYAASLLTDPSTKPIHNYALGRGAFFREPNLSGTRQAMTSFAWEVNEPGSNIAFRMTFSNTP